MKHVDRHDPATRTWVNDAIRAVEADANRSCDTHLHVFSAPALVGRGPLPERRVGPPDRFSLKHRLARSLFLYGLANGWIGPSTTVIEASSGSTAVSEAYFARLLGLPFIAVIPATTSPEKREIIEFYGGRCHLVDDPGRSTKSPPAWPRRPAATTWTSSPTPSGPPTGAATTTSPRASTSRWRWSASPSPPGSSSAPGTGGTSATIGRYIRYRRHATRLCVADPEGSAFYPSWVTGGSHAGDPVQDRGHRPPRVEPSFLPMVIDRMTSVPDATSIAAMRWVNEVTHHEVGASTGTSVAAAMEDHPRDAQPRRQRQRGDADLATAPPATRGPT